MSGSSTNTLGKYQIIREIARSNDIVYEAIDPSINRRLALKELSLPPNLTAAQKQERVERFLREGRAAGRLSHPNIVTIFDVGKDGDRFYIAMEYLEGQTLRDVLTSGGALSIRDTVNYTLQLCNALSYAHANGVVHRDIKPDNVQILPGGYVKLTDFGIARLMGESSITQDGQVFGTPSYMSPEQVAGKPIDARSDIFSLGVMLYEMVAGKKPFTGDSVVTITYNIVNTDAPAPPGSPPYLVSIIRKAMAKDPDMRYTSVDQMAQDIREERSADGFSLAPAASTAWPGTNDPFAQGPVRAPSPQHVPSAPSTGTGGYAGTAPDPFSGGGSSQSPNPFSHGGTASAPVFIPPPPSKPIISAETKNFIGIFLLTIALAGMLVFAIWAVKLAYEGYQTAVTSKPAMQHVDAGDKAKANGDQTTAVQEWTRAVQESPKSEAAKAAKERLYNYYVQLAGQSMARNDFADLKDKGNILVEQFADQPEGYYCLGVAFEFTNDPEKAKENYVKSIQKGKGSDARIRVGPMFITEGDEKRAAGDIEGAIAAYNKAIEYGQTDIIQMAQDRKQSLIQGKPR